MDYKAWALEKIIWAGNHKTNKSNRRGYGIEAIVNHITEGSAQSCINWFTSENNKESSAHFLVSKKGEIFQFVDMKEMAWANGLKLEDIPKARSELVIEKKVNPNWYTVSIEHEGIYGETKGRLTEKQLQATKELHEYIIWFAKETYKHDITISRKFILGHNEISPVLKPQCPGEEFPFSEIISSLRKESNGEAFSDIHGHWAKNAITRAKELGIVNGYQDGRFLPYEAVTRAEAVVMLMNLYDKLK